MIQITMQDKNQALIQITSDAEQTEENLNLVRNQVKTLYSEQQHIAMATAFEAKELSASFKKIEAAEMTVESIMADANAVKPNDTPTPSE